jgi:hypothetical protein
MNTELEEFANMLPIREWVAIKAAAELANEGRHGEAELQRFVAGYHENAILRFEAARLG